MRTYIIGTFAKKQTVIYKLNRQGKLAARVKAIQSLDL